MDDAVRTFFDGLASRRGEIPETISGTLRFDLRDGELTGRWLVTFDRGMVTAERSDAAADCVVDTSRDTMAAVIEGRMNLMAALLRGAVRVEGDALLLGVFRFLLTTPEETPATVRPVPAAAGGPS